MLRTDRGGEFCSKEFLNFCDEQGILGHYRVPYTHQQNGVVESRNRTVVAMARSLLSERKVPQMYLGEAVCHAVYVLNKLPTRSMSTVTPHEAWFNRKQNVEFLRVFGCVAYMKIPSVHTQKLDKCSKLVVHFAREPGTKAYRLFDPLTGSIQISRDVVFDEDKAWPWEQNLDTATQVTQQFTLDCPPKETIKTSSSTTEIQSPLPELQTPVHPQTESVTEDRASSSGTYADSEQPHKFRSLADIMIIPLRLS